MFSYKLDYETITPTTSGYFDGNIAKQTWHNGTVQRSYSYNYDVANRLKSATYSGVNGEDYSIPNMNYDANGNITNLQRKGKLGNGWGLIDNLTYTRTGNRLSQITDNIGGNHEVDFVQRGGANYTYYNDGSLKSDANEQIQNIVYDSFLGQPTQVQLTDGTINHYYDGSGQLLKNVYSNGEYWEFSNEFIYKNGVLYQANDDEGRILYQNGQYVYEFDYKDHLGNTRLSFRANNGQLEKVAETSFDPWGVVLNGIGQQNTTKNRWEMQGKEKESTFGLNRLAFGARTYNPTTVVWDNIDLLSEKYYGISPYVYLLNNPINAIDPDGRDIDVSRFQGKSEQEVLRKFLSTETGYKFFSQFANEGDVVAGVKFGKTGEYAKDVLTLQSTDNVNMVLYDGLTQTFERNSKKGGSIYGKELQNADQTSDVSKGVIHLIRIHSGLGETKTLNTLNHEAFVHVQEDVKRLAELRDGKIKPGTPDYIDQLRLTGKSADIDHLRLGQGKATEYKMQVNQLDKKYNTNIYTNFYNQDVKNHKK